MSIAIVILARNEQEGIGNVLAQLSKQTLLASGVEAITVHVVVNGSTDSTAERARAEENSFGPPHQLVVHDLPQGGKSRSWNKAVHELVGEDAEFIFFIDADIAFVDDEVLAELLATLIDHPDAAVATGYPVKAIATKVRKSLLDRFSLAISRQSRHAGAINGSLYVGRADELRAISLPNETPGEDGFLNAMVTTHGFSRPFNPARVIGSDRPTHYFEAHHPAAFFRHERRMIVGTMVNIWLFEHLWSLRLQQPAGSLIRQWNKERPDWVEQVLRRSAGKRHWTVRSEILLGRLAAGRDRPAAKRLLFLPLALAATILTIPPALAANRALKRLGAAKTW